MIHSDDGREQPGARGDQPIGRSLQGARTDDPAHSNPSTYFNRITVANTPAPYELAESIGGNQQPGTTENTGGTMLYTFDVQGRAAVTVSMWELGTGGNNSPLGVDFSSRCSDLRCVS